MSSFTLQDVREQTYKPRDSWWTVLLVDPLASRLVKTTANRTSVTPNQLTIAALLLGIVAAVCFAMADWQWLLLGAVLFHFSFVLDCMDGKIARLKGTGSVFGSWLDYVFDRVRVLICAVALMGGQFAVTGNPVFIWFTLGIVFVDMFRYLNSPQMAKVRKNMQERMKKELESLRPVHDRDELVRLVGPPWAALVDAEQREAATETPDINAAASAAAQPKQAPTAPQGGLSARFPLYGRFREALGRRRIRPHLFSGIEFQMGVFIVAPLVGIFSTTALLVVIVLSGAAMMTFELLIIYRLWLSTRGFEQAMRRIDGARTASRHLEHSVAEPTLVGEN